MKKVAYIISLIILFFMIGYCIANNQKSKTIDNIRYQYISSYQYIPTVSRPTDQIVTETGTLVDKYRIIDHQVGVSFDYFLYNTNPSKTRFQKIQDEIHHRIHPIYHNTFLYVYPNAINISKITLQTGEIITNTNQFNSILKKYFSGLNNSGCVLSDNVYGNELTELFSGSRYITKVYDAPSENLVTHIDNEDSQAEVCPFTSNYRFPLFVFDKQQPEYIMICIVPEGLGGRSDTRWIQTLKR